MDPTYTEYPPPDPPPGRDCLVKLGSSRRFGADTCVLEYVHTYRGTRTREFICTVHTGRAYEFRAM